MVWFGGYFYIIGHLPRVGGSKPVSSVRVCVAYYPRACWTLAMSRDMHWELSGGFQIAHGVYMYESLKIIEIPQSANFLYSRDHHTGTSAWMDPFFFLYIYTFLFFPCCRSHQATYSCQVSIEMLFLRGNPTPNSFLFGTTNGEVILHGCRGKSFVQEPNNGNVVVVVGLNLGPSNASTTEPSLLGLYPERKCPKVATRQWRGSTPWPFTQ